MRRTLETLLSQRWILKSRDRELYYELKEELASGEEKKFLMEKLGYPLIVNPYMIKVEKIPAAPENWMGILEFTSKLEYIFFCLVLMFLEDKEAEEQFVLSELTEYIQGQYREEQVDWTVYRYRRHLIKVMKYCVACGILNVNDGSEEGFARDDANEVLYENTGVSRYFMRNFTQDIMGYASPQDFAAIFLGFSESSFPISIIITGSMRQERTMKIIPFTEKYRDDTIFMILEAKNALGRIPGLNPDLLDIQKNYFDRGDMFWIALDEHDRVIGSVGFHVHENREDVTLHRLFVKCSRKRQGIGTALLDTAEQYVRALGKKTIYIHLGIGQEWYESRAFYRKNGYWEYEPNQMKKLISEDR